MASCVPEIIQRYNLILTTKEAKWLRDLCQNSVSAAETVEEKELRESIFRVLRHQEIK